MTCRQSDYVEFSLGHMHVSTWGSPDKPALVMWHGLARTGRDFDEISCHFAEDYFVICPDTIGRGLSDWARDPASEYALATYCAQALALLEHYKIDKLRWVGTSMGALIGMKLAGGALVDRISHLVINDIGPEIPSDALDRIIEYVGAPPAFDSVPAFEQWLREVYAPFGVNSETFWRRMADTSVRRRSDGKVTAHYDPKIVCQFTENSHEMPIWDDYDQITAKSCLIGGQDSDLLRPALAVEMCERGPKPSFHSIPDCGHAPTLNAPEALDLLERFLVS